MPTDKADMISKNRFPIQLFKRDNLYKNDLNDHVSNVDDDMNNTHLTNLSTDYSDSFFHKSTTNTINSDENQNLSKSSSKQFRRVSIKKLCNSEKPTETGNTWMKPPTCADDDAPILHKRHSTVTVQRIKNLVKPNKTNDIPQTIDQGVPLALTPNTSPFKFTKSPQERPSNSGHGSVMDAEKSSIEMKPITNQLQGSSSAEHKKTNNTITVVKRPRKSTTN